MSVRVNQRWPTDVKAAVDELAARSGQSATDITLAAVRQHLELPAAPEDEGLPAAPGPRGPEEGSGRRAHVKRPARRPPEPVTVGLPNAIQLSTRTGLPKATCQGYLDRGQVRWRPRPESSDVLLEMKERGEWRVIP